MERSQQRSIAEALIAGTPEPIPAQRVAGLVPGATPSLVRQLVDELNAEYGEAGRAYEIREVAGGYQLRTRAEYASYLQQAQPTRPLRLSQAALETLSIVAYRQPATRAEIEHIRGVDAGPVLRSLLERRLVRIAGHREVPGRPLLYVTSRRFLEVFGLARLEDLPTLRDLEEVAPELGLTLPGQAETPEPGAGESPDEAETTESPIQTLVDAEPVGKPH